MGKGGGVDGTGSRGDGLWMGMDRGRGCEGGDEWRVLKERREGYEQGGMDLRHGLATEN